MGFMDKYVGKAKKAWKDAQPIIEQVKTNSEATVKAVTDLVNGALQDPATPAAPAKDTTIPRMNDGPNLGKSPVPAKKNSVKKNSAPAQEEINDFLEHAHCANEKPVMEFLDKYGDFINAKDSIGWTALMLAAWDGNGSLTRLLLERGASLDEKNDNGETALVLARRENHPEVIAILEKAATPVAETAPKAKKKASAEKTPKA